MHKRRLVTLAVAGMALLVMGVSTWGSFASDGTSPKGDAPTRSAADAAAPSATATDQITALKQQMALQQKQIEQMQKALDAQRLLLEKLVKPSATVEQAAQPASPAQPASVAAPAQSASAVTPAQPASAATPANPVVATGQGSPSHASTLGQVASNSPIIPNQAKADSSLAPLSVGQKEIMDTESSPLQIHLGTATITPVAFMDFTSVYRDHDTNGSIATNFGSIPYQSTGYTSNLSEFRLSSENSRLGLRVDAEVHGAHVMGYMEADFHGNNATNVAVVTNSNTLRERLYWVDLNTGHFEIMGGQTWSLITPGRSGISPLPADIFYSQDVDVNYQLGLVFGRIPELRFVYHPNKKAAFAVAIDSPDQYAGGYGGAGSIVLPTALNTTGTYQGELDYGGGNTLSTPNVAPDVIAKLAIDPSKRAHLEFGGIERTFKVWNPLDTTSYTAVGGGGFINLNFELAKGFRVLTNNYISDGGGRYIYGQAPDLIAEASGNISLIHSGSTVSGFEFTQKKSMIYAYYGGMYAERNTAVDTTGKLVGFGIGSGSNATNAQNRAIQEATVGFNQTIWKNAKYGALNFMGQYSYLTRDPYFVPSGTLPDASINMLFFNLRYSLPGSAPTMGE